MQLQISYISFCREVTSQYWVVPKLSNFLIPFIPGIANGQETISSQSIRFSHKRCNSVLSIMMFDKHHPRMSNRFAIPDINGCLLSPPASHAVRTIDLNVFEMVSHSTPKTLTRSFEYVIRHDDCWSCRCCGMLSSIILLLAFHFLSLKPPIEKGIVTFLVTSLHCPRHLCPPGQCQWSRLSKWHLHFPDALLDDPMRFTSEPWWLQIRARIHRMSV